MTSIWPAGGLWRQLAFVAATLCAAGCGSSGTGNDGGGGNGNNSMTANVDGSGFTASETGATWSGGDLDVGGQVTVGGTLKRINIFANGVDGPGMFALGAQPISSATYTETTGGATLSWSSSFEGATGSVTVTAISATHVSGTFSFTAPAVTHTGSTGTRSVTSGSFSMDVQ